MADEALTVAAFLRAMHDMEASPYRGPVLVLHPRMTADLNRAVAREATRTARESTRWSRKARRAQQRYDMRPRLDWWGRPLTRSSSRQPAASDDGKTGTSG